MSRASLADIEQSHWGGSTSTPSPGIEGMIFGRMQAPSPSPSFRTASPMAYDFQGLTNPTATGRLRELEQQNTLLMQQNYRLKHKCRQAYDALLRRLPPTGQSLPSAPESQPYTPTPSTVAEAALAAVRNPPPFVMLLQENYPKVQFWHAQLFGPYLKAKEDALKLNNKSDPDLPYHFLETEDGQPVNEVDTKMRAKMCATLYTIWHGLLEVPGLLPKTRSFGYATVITRHISWRP
ncbi:uncharacterized protein SCHCODRAFT_01038257 [Schizophyllum commune H4-8]|uniref:Expressed protein n=1 Tax=Schizophyllum commune (strain H4-8 / FGSC 9210) TaxID=578458 RepID=D8PXD7_SCHCM|nr:uncharacterized protein SCHCODRAFT_01038257 [Schizophyllum commune H4-8]KAI5896871.1 hypothetical protein SCHCODRAFT_01038257 [Schizophyllum commune H4-8]